MDSKSLTDKVIDSIAFKSLLIENNVVSTLKDLGWAVYHSSYFTDLDTSKQREIDVIAKRKIRIALSKEDFLFVFLNLVVECKSLEKYHILLANQIEEKDIDLQCSWCGDFINGFPKKTTKILSKYKQKIKLKNFYLKAHEICYPGGVSLIHEFVPSEIPEMNTYSSFRETNLDITKDLENSVLWKGSMALKSLINYSKEKEQKEFEEELDFQFHFSKVYEYKLSKQLFDAVHTECRRVHLFHPIMVMDSHLWDVKEKASQIDSCRLVEYDEKGRIINWLDLVSNSYFLNYAKYLTEFYTNFYNRFTAETIL